MQDRIVGAFFFFHHLDQMAPVERQAGFESLAAAGVNTILTESDTYKAEILAEARAAGLAFWGGIACFLHQNSTGNVLEREPSLTPILSTGERRETIEWYNGIAPTARSFRDERRAHLLEQVSQHRFDGFLLDFIRWPMHWEVEYRPGYPPPLDNSFDQTTLREFRARSGVELPTDLITQPGAAASWIALNAPREWVDFKCDVITSYVREIKESLSATAERDVPLGICGVPINPEWVGQRYSDLAGVVDLVCPMSYHPVLYRPPGWVKDNVAGIVEEAPGQVAPILQVFTDGTEFGADFGPAVSDEEFRQVLSDVLDLDVRGVIVFTGSELLKPGRLEGLRSALAHRTE